MAFNKYIIHRAAQVILLFFLFSLCWSWAKKTPLSSNIQTGDFSLNLVPKAFCLDLWNAIGKMPQSTPLLRRSVNLVLIRSCFLLHRRSWYIWWTIFLKLPQRFPSPFVLLLSGDNYREQSGTIVTIVNNSSLYSKGRFLQSQDFRKLSS